jgi:hypothetical protein
LAHGNDLPPEERELFGQMSARYLLVTSAAAYAITKKSRS